MNKLLRKLPETIEGHKILRPSNFGKHPKELYQPKYVFPNALADAIVFIRHKKLLPVIDTGCYVFGG